MAAPATAGLASASDRASRSISAAAAAKHPSPIAPIGPASWSTKIEEQPTSAATSAPDFRSATAAAVIATTHAVLPIDPNTERLPVSGLLK